MKIDKRFVDIIHDGMYSTGLFDINHYFNSAGLPKQIIAGFIVNVVSNASYHHSRIYIQHRKLPNAEGIVDFEDFRIHLEVENSDNIDIDVYYYPVKRRMVMGLLGYEGATGTHQYPEFVLTDDEAEYFQMQCGTDDDMIFTFEEQRSIMYFFDTVMEYSSLQKNLVRNKVYGSSRF